MREIRIFVDDATLGSGSALLTGQAARHVSKVLRMTAGQSLTVFDGRGHEYPATIVRCTSSAVELKLGEATTAEKESPLRVTLAMALTRGERMDFAIQKATELGVSEIIPLQSSRSVVHLKAQRAEKRLLHWQRVAASACEQCGRNRLPLLNPVTDLADWLGGLEAPVSYERRLFADPQANPAFAADAATPGTVRLLIGAEGGFTQAEAGLARECGFEAIWLGPRILRAETAAIALLAVMQWQFGDLKAS